MIAATVHARARAVLGRAVVHDERALDSLDDLADRHVLGVDLEAHAAAHAAQALDDTRLDQAVLDRTGKRIGHVHGFGGSADRQKTVLTFRQHGKHAQGVVGLPGDIHLFSLQANGGRAADAHAAAQRRGATNERSSRFRVRPVIYTVSLSGAGDAQHMEGFRPPCACSL